VPHKTPSRTVWQEIVNHIFDGFKWHDLVDGDVNQFAAIYADSTASNHGLPFWLGKITRINRERRPEDDNEELEDDAEEHETYEAVEIADYYQKTKKNRSGVVEPTGQYDKHRVAGAAVGRTGRTTSSQVKTWVPASQVIHVFPELTRGGLVPKQELSWIAHYCEVAWKTGGVAVVGAEAFNTSLGFKTLPRPPPPA
jgi:hypothetical protein